jgi:predicted dehydrogenase
MARGTSHKAPGGWQDGHRFYGFSLICKGNFTVSMGFAIVGCGFVADLYMATLAQHPELRLAGAWDRDPARLQAFCSYHQVVPYASLEALLADPAVQLVANLTNPRSHYEVSRAALEAGRHVYSEKPLATELAQAEALVALAEARGRLITSAPCGLLSETAQTLWKALREGQIGTPRLIYAELDDGNVAAMDYARWISDSGAPWPARDEFEVGCTLEHAGYYLTWLTALFGPVRRMSTFAHVVQPDKGMAHLVPAPDFAAACFEFESGPVARLTCSIFAAHDHRLRIFGDEGTLSVDKVWHYGAPVKLSQRHRWTSRAEKYPRLAQLLGLGPRTLPLVRPCTVKVKTRGTRNVMDFCRGISDLAEAIRTGQPPHMSARWSLHVNELVLAMQEPERYGHSREIHSRFEPVAPADWAR